jgi:hypothetical protein
MEETAVRELREVGFGSVRSRFKIKGRSAGKTAKLREFFNVFEYRSKPGEKYQSLKKKFRNQMDDR